MKCKERQTISVRATKATEVSRQESFCSLKASGHTGLVYVAVDFLRSMDISVNQRTEL